MDTTYIIIMMSGVKLRLVNPSFTGEKFKANYDVSKCGLSRFTCFRFSLTY